LPGSNNPLVLQSSNTRLHQAIKAIGSMSVFILDGLILYSTNQVLKMRE